MAKAEKDKEAEAETEAEVMWNWHLLQLPGVHQIAWLLKATLLQIK